MKYVSIGIVIVFIALVVGFWVKGAPKEVAPTDTVATEQLPVTSTAEEATPAPETPQKTKTNKTTTIQGMKIETTKEGTGVAIKVGQTAVVHYTGKLENGTTFDSSVTRGTPFEFPLGAGMVIKGWDLGVEGMKIGEKRILTIPAELGYGARGAGAVIPSNATLIFDVELLGIK